MSDKKSTSSSCFNLGSVVISWSSRKQSCVAQSTAEAEYIAACMAAKEVVWLRKLLGGLFGQPLEPSMIMCDNQSCIKLLVNPVFHGRSKHVEIKFHYLRDMVQRNAVELKYIATEEKTADILTKPLPKVKFCHFREHLDLVENEALVEKAPQAECFISYMHSSLGEV